MVPTEGTITYRKDRTSTQRRKGREVFRSKKALDEWLWGLATTLARRLSTNGVVISKEAVYEALHAELTVEDVMELNS